MTTEKKKKKETHWKWQTQNICLFSILVELVLVCVVVSGSLCLRVADVCIMNWVEMYLCNKKWKKSEKAHRLAFAFKMLLFSPLKKNCEKATLCTPLPSFAILLAVHFTTAAHTHTHVRLESERPFHHSFINKTIENGKLSVDRRVCRRNAPLPPPKNKRQLPNDDHFKSVEENNQLFCTHLPHRFSFSFECMWLPGCGMSVCLMASPSSSSFFFVLFFLFLLLRLFHSLNLCDKPKLTN